MEHVEEGWAPPVREASRAARRSLTRRRVLVGAGAASATAALVPVWRAGGVSLAQSANSDVDVANFGITFDYMMAEFLDKGLNAGVVTDTREIEILREIRGHIAATLSSVSQLATALGGTPIERPPFTFPDELTADRDAFITQAAAFAELGVSGYHGQITIIKDLGALASAASVAGAKSRHAAILTVLAGGDPLPSPVETARTLEQVLEAAAPFRGEGAA